MLISYIFFSFIYFNILCQIYDNFSSYVLENENPDLLDIVDYQNLFLIVSTSQKIYSGIPPLLKTNTSAAFNQNTSILVINENFILATCLNDSLLTKININNGNSSSLLEYSDIINNEILSPNAICTISMTMNTVYIGISEINSKNFVKNIIIKLNLILENNDEPFIDKETIKYFSLPLIPQINFKRQISCDSILFNDNNDEESRLICIFIDKDETENLNLYNIIINKEFDGIEYKSIFMPLNYEISFKLYRIDPYVTKIFLHNQMYNLNLEKNGENFCIRINNIISNISSYNGCYELVDYNNHFIFISEICSANKNDIKINLFNIYIKTEYSTNYYKIYDFSTADSNLGLTRILGYYNNKNKYILCIYKSFEKIKYFIMNNNNIFNIKSNSFNYKIKSKEEIQYEINNVIESEENFGNLGIIIQNNISNNNETFEYELYGNTFPFNKTSQKLSSYSMKNERIEYTLGFIEEENNFLRMFIFENSKITIKICAFQCGSCENDYLKCDTCINSNFSKLDNNEDNNCYPNNQRFEGYIYNETTTKFEKCYLTCRFCSLMNSESSSLRHNCEECAEGYFPSYEYPGNCYKIINNSISLDKIVNNKEDEYFTLINSCYEISKYKINNTGECIEACPLESSYYIFNENYINFTEQEKEPLTLLHFSKIERLPSKYYLGNICYEKCPLNSKLLNNNSQICECQYAWHKDNSTGEIICYNEKFCIYDEYKYFINETNECVHICPINFSVLDNQCINKCPYYYYNNNNNFICLEKYEGLNYPYINPYTNECFINLEDCFSKNNLFFFNQFCYKDRCPPNTIILSSINDQIIKSKLINDLSLDNNLEDRICICDIINSNLYWELNISNNNYFQICVNKCPINYRLDILTHKCIKINKVEIIYPQEYYDNPNNCLAIYNNKCYSQCPKGTCLTQEDINLIYCIDLEPYMVVFNYICFENLEEIFSNIKNLPLSGQSISIHKNINIKVYINKIEAYDLLTKYSNLTVLYLNECEDLLIQKFNLLPLTNLYILGIESPNKNNNTAGNIYNYGIFLENGTQLTDLSICKEIKLTLSIPIINEELIQYENAKYFSSFGYDIYNKSNKFYTDICSPAAINSNDITLSDRYIDFYPSNISLCNDSCYYNYINYTNKRIICYCYIGNDNNYSNINDENTTEIENYLDYFVSFINIKIIKCYNSFLKFENYYKNIGFYIGSGATIIFIVEMIIYIHFGNLNLNKIIFQSIPKNKKKINLNKIKLNLKKNKDKYIKSSLYHSDENLQSNPPKKNYYINIMNINNVINLNNNNNNQNNKIINSSFKSIKNKKRKYIKNKTSDYFQIYKNNLEEQVSNKHDLIRKEPKDLNNIPYTLALIIDKRTFLQIFVSSLAKEINCISIFYYNNKYIHLSITTSSYIIQLLLDFTLNCFFYSDHIVSEKYHNHGKLNFFTSLFLSIISNIFSYIICKLIEKIYDYSSLIEMIINEIKDKKYYYLNIIRFKKYKNIKISLFYFLEYFINIILIYYLIIFFSVYYYIEKSVFINYLIGLIESLLLTIALSLCISLLRFISLKKKINYLYNTSKFLFENFLC